jgi:hypothetical protein
MCWKQISSLFTIKSHKESLSPIRLCCALVVTPDIVRALSLFLARVVGWYIFDDSFILKTNVIGEKKTVWEKSNTRV